MRMHSHNLLYLMNSSMQRYREDDETQLKCMAYLASQRWIFTSLQSCANTSHTLCYTNAMNTIFVSALLIKLSKGQASLQNGEQ